MEPARLPPGPRRRPRARARGRRRSWLMSQRLSGCAALGFALLFAGLALDSVEFDRTLRGPGVRTASATVVEVHDCSGRCDPYVVVRFPTVRGDVTADLHDVFWDPGPRVGDIVTIRYGPVDPRTYLRDERLGDDPLGQAMLGTVSALFAVFGLTALAGRLPARIVGPR